MLFPYHPTTDTLPQGYLPRHEWPEYLSELDIVQNLSPRRINSTPRGRSWGWWPLYMEEYISDTEPVITEDHPQRAPICIIRWQRLTRTDIPQNWRQLSNKVFHIEGFADLHGKVEYPKYWSESLRRGYREWREFENNGCTIVLLTYTEFKEAYNLSPVAKRTKSESIQSTKEMLEHGSPDIQLWGVCHEGKIIAGLSIINSPSTKASYYMCGFIQEKTQEIPAMIGLMHHWHVESASQGFRFLHFGYFWCPGRPTGWRGFSNFKSKFGLTYINYSPSLYMLRIRFRR